MTKLYKFHINFHNLIIYKLLLITSISINMLYLLYCDKNKYLINIFLYEKMGIK